MWKYNYIMSSNELYHHGVLGQKWGIRRYQPYPKGERVQGKKRIRIVYKRRKFV